MAKKKAVVIVSDAQAEKFFEVKKGFNLADETRFNVGTTKPNFVKKSQFKHDEWEELVKMEAVAPVLAPEETRKGMEEE